MQTRLYSVAAAVLASGFVMSGAGCVSLGPNLGFLAYPIPVSPYHMKKQEDRKWNHERYDKMPILAPIPPGGPTEAIDPPSDDEVMRAIEEIDPVQGGIPLMHEVQRNNVLIHKQKIADYIDPPRIYPLVGPAQVHHSRWKCTVYYTRVVRPGWPLPQHYTDNTQEVVYIDHTHLHRVGNPNENLGPAPLTPTTGGQPPPVAVPPTASPPPSAAPPPAAKT